MGKGFLFALACAGLGVPAFATAGGDDKPVETLVRKSKWLANYDRDSCSLGVELGEEGKPSVVVQFTRYELGDGFDLSVFGDRFATSDVKVEGTADFGVAKKPIAIDGLSGNTGKLKAVFFGGMRLDGWRGKDSTKERPEVPPEITPEQEARVTGMTLDIRGKRPVRLEFGPLAKPFAEMRKCVDSLVRSWGYDPAQQAAALRPVSPVTMPQGWLNSSDYPPGALSQGHNGLVQFRLDVDPEGKVAGCYVLARTNPDDFADITCRAVAKRAKLRPALDAQGKPMRSYWICKVHWLA